RRKQADGEIYRLNEELKRQGSEAQQANQELEAFSYSVSHDLRAPLRAMNGFSRILLEDHAPHLPEETREDLQLVRTCPQQMDRLIEDLPNFPRLSRQPLQKDTIAPADLVRQVLEELRGERQGRCIDVAVGGLPPCRADPSLLKQVFANLLANA